MNYDISQISTIIGAHRYGKREQTVSFLLTDSRSLSFPEETLFFAIKTERNDGHKYIEELYRRGVRNFVVTQLPETLQDDANYLLVESSIGALQQLSRHHRNAFSIPVVGITGSNGKTMVKEWLYQLLMPSQTVTRSPRSYNSQIGVPLSVWNLNSHTQTAIFEAGISRPGEMQHLADVIQPTIGILTNIGQAHRENFTTQLDKCREKMLLFQGSRTLIYPADDDCVISYLSTASVGESAQATSTASVGNPATPSQTTPLMIGISQTDDKAPFYISKVERIGEGKTEIHYTFRNPNGEQESVSAAYALPFISKAAIHNSFLCAAAALLLGITPEELSQRMGTLQPVAMRLEVIQARNNCIIINDSYNSDIPSLDIALDFISRRTHLAPSAAESASPATVQAAFQTGSVPRTNALILSDIEQTGLSDVEICQKVMPLIMQRGIKKLITIGHQITPSTLSQAGINTNGLLFANYHDTPQFLASSTFGTLRDENILIKGARSFRFDDITAMLISQVHETTMEINLSALKANLGYYRSFMKPTTKLCCMIKADAYGAGAIEIAKTLQDNHVDYLAVAVADEGAALRKAGITADIIVMNPEMTALNTIFAYDLQPEIYSFRILHAMHQAAEKQGVVGWPVHIKLDTGMHRLGFHPEEDMDELITTLKAHHTLTPRSVFSHFVGSDDDAFDDFSAQQYDLFTKGADTLQQAFPHHILRHICNSAGIEHFPERQLDLCRLGLGLYGINPRNNETIHTVATLKTTILQMRHLKAGETVGYSRRTTLERDSTIAAIPIGYADGLNRHLGNRHAYCLVNGQKAWYVGNICMDVSMIDVTGIDCKEGDTVELFGNNLPVTTLSDILDTIPYEVLTTISNRVRRIYFEEN